MYKIADPDDFRMKIRNKLFAIVENERISENIEKGVFNYSIQKASEMNIVKKWDNVYFIRVYVDRLRTLFMNLQTNDSLRKQIKDKKIRAHKIAFMTHQDMKPEHWKELLEAKKIRDDNKYAPEIYANTDTFTCRKCKSNRCSYYQLQTRSADEPMTTFVTCIDCGNRWKC
jgi:transcription elongation factor S-II